MKYLSLDVAKTTGYSIWEDSELIETGTIDLSHISPKDYKTKFEYYEALRLEFYYKLWEVLAHAIPHMVIIEKPLGSKSATAANIFQLLHTVLTITLMKYSLPKEYIKVKDWKQHFGIYGLGTKEAKQKSIELAGVKDHNIADSILMFRYWREK